MTENGEITITLTETEVEYILHVLSHYTSLEDIRKVCRILTAHFPVVELGNDAL